MADFIDRAKLEALADGHTREDAMDAWEKRYDDFMAGAAAYAALLDAETTEEWGVRDVFAVTRTYRTEAVARSNHAPGYSKIVSRRVLYGPWLPSEGGEKP